MLLDRETRLAIAAGLSAPSARFLVDMFYSIQDFRIQCEGQVRAISQDADQGIDIIVERVTDVMAHTERQISKALGDYAQKGAPGRWAMSIHGIGPIIAAGLIAHIDIEKAPTVGHIWRFAGLDPTVTWNKGEKRPWNAKLKVLCWKMADSFVKQRNSPKDIYGKIYQERKELELLRNEQGLFEDQAKESLEKRKIQDKDLKKTYESGKLPLGRLDLRARRYSVKIFLAHLHHVMHEDFYGEKPPKPYVISHLGHGHFLGPPGWPMEE